MMASLLPLLILSISVFLPFSFSSPVSAATNSITINIDDSPVELNNTATSSTGTFVKSNSKSFSVSTTNSAGYTLKIAASDGSNYNKLINSDDNNPETNSFISITNDIDEGTFKNVDNTNYNGKWGYLPSKYCKNENGTTSCSDNARFLPAPNGTTGDTLDITTTSNPTTANTYNLSLGARVDSSISLGTYTNVYLVSATANPISYSIVYDDNVVSNMPTDVNSGQAVNGLVPFSSNTPTRDGYTFLGWCDERPVTANGIDSCGGNQYAVNGTKTITSATGFQLYAMWQKNITYMQDYTLAKCQSEATNHDITVYDRRDKSDYTVRYINGACWMTQNLRITGTIPATDSNFTGSDFNTMAGGDLRDRSADSYTDAVSHLADYTDVKDENVVYSTTELGAWYNYCAASAGEVCQNTTKQDATQDICPAGWHLPTGGVAPGAFSDITSQASAFSPIYGGSYYDGSFRDAVKYGDWWSATAYDSIHQYRAYYSNGNLLLGRDGKGRGYHIRCVRTE